MARRAFICGLAGPALTGDEARFLKEHKPAGVILFARNVENPGQVRSLIANVRTEAAPDAILVLVDQEGGRVQRLAPPHWNRYPAAARFYETISGGSVAAALHKTALCARLLAHDLHDLGIDTCCAPVLDIPVEGADAVIGDRAYGTDAATVTAFGGAAALALLDGGILPVVKHIPGHGRATADSHFSLPVIATPLSQLEKTDFVPFAALSALPIAMTAHVILSAVDTGLPVTLSKTAIDAVIRGSIGFRNLLISDDLSMKALSGGMAKRAAGATSAGCDLVLHCNGVLGEMEDIAEAVPYLDGDAEARFWGALAHLRPALPFDTAQAESVRKELVAPVA